MVSTHYTNRSVRKYIHNIVKISGFEKKTNLDIF